METKRLYWWKATASFIFVLLMMPLGHALMILMEHFLSPTALHYGAFAMGAVGVLFAVIGLYPSGDTKRTLWGLIGGMLFWTGWVEFLFQYYANRYGTMPQLDPATGKVVTRPEYLIFPASFGFWVLILLIYCFGARTGCNFISWIQKRFLRSLTPHHPLTRNSSITTFAELVMVMWTCYLALMFCYDDTFLGDKHPVTLIFGALCLAGAIYVFYKQLHIPAWGANIRMAIPAVILLWTPVEILGRNDLLSEIWIAPLQHAPQMSLMLVAFAALGAYLYYLTRKRRAGD